MLSPWGKTEPRSLPPMAITNSVLAAVQDITRYPTCLHVKEALQSIVFYPSFRLGTSLAGNEELQDALGTRLVERTVRVAASGRNLLNALRTLSQEYPREWRALLTDLNAVFPWCQSVLFPPGAGRGRITLTWIDSRSGATLYLDDMSEGMRVYLALLAALHAPDTPALIAFDEPERSLHPRALRRFVHVMESRAEAVPILVATHADRLLDFLEEPAKSLGIRAIDVEFNGGIDCVGGQGQGPEHGGACAVFCSKHVRHVMRVAHRRASLLCESLSRTHKHAGGARFVRGQESSRCGIPWGLGRSRRQCEEIFRNMTHSSERGGTDFPKRGAFERA